MKVLIIILLFLLFLVLLTPLIFSDFSLKLRLNELNKLNELNELNEIGTKSFYRGEQLWFENKPRTFLNANNHCVINNSQMANLDDMIRAYDVGSNTCNLGWIDNATTVFPSQEAKCLGNKRLNALNTNVEDKSGVWCVGSVPKSADYSIGI